MPDDTHLVPLDADALLDDRIRVRIATHRGQIELFSVQYEASIGERMMAVARYDSSHGVAHRDLLDRFGRNMDKRWFPGVPLDQALTFAIQDFKLNWRRYRQDFIRREGLDR